MAGPRTPAFGGRPVVSAGLTGPALLSCNGPFTRLPAVIIDMSTPLGENPGPLAWRHRPGQNRGPIKGPAAAWVAWPRRGVHSTRNATANGCSPARDPSTGVLGYSHTVPTGRPPRRICHRPPAHLAGNTSALPANPRSGRQARRVSYRYLDHVGRTCISTNSGGKLVRRQESWRWNKPVATWDPGSRPEPLASVR